MRAVRRGIPPQVRFLNGTVAAISLSAMSLGIPAITIDGGGDGKDAHALTERFDTTDSWKGTQRAILIAVALAR